MPFGNRDIYFRGSFFVQYCHYFKKNHPSRNLKFNNLGIFQSLKLRNLMRKIFQISLELNFTSNTLGCYGLIHWQYQHKLEKTTTKINTCQPFFPLLYLKVNL